MSAHPVAVIDPDSPADQRRLLDILRNSGAFRGVVSQDIALDCIGDALREFANPTLSEPTNPTARVTDRRENIWRLLADGDWVCTSGPDSGEYLAWSGLTERGPLSVEVTP
jgi:hypothetical protein